MKPAALSLLLLISCSQGTPGRDWEHADAAAAGWDAEKLESARKFAESLDTAALLVVHKGKVVLDFGNTATRYNPQSMRKSLLSALIGIAVGRGQIDRDATLAALSIDDVDGLTPAEKQATVRDLLMARSGVYHSALYETRSNKQEKPPRGSHPPGEFFYYNNWDFNALGTIYEKATGTAIGEAFARELARPTEMQDFRARDVVYLTRRSLTERITGNRSDHRAYIRRTEREHVQAGGGYCRRRGTRDPGALFQPAHSSEARGVERRVCRETARPRPPHGPPGGLHRNDHLTAVH